MTVTGMAYRAVVVARSGSRLAALPGAGRLRQLGGAA